MRFTGIVVTAFILLLPLAPAHAAEQGAAIRAGELKAQPFLDAATTDRLAARQKVTIVRRQGGWAQVQTNGKSGWVRLLNIRLDAVAAPRRGSSSASLLRTGSSGTTVTTGVKGLDEEDIKNARPDPLQVAALDAMTVAPAEATANARQSGLRESQIDYLDKGNAK